MTEPAGHVTEAELHGYFDGELSPERRRAVEAHLATHPEDADRLESYRGHDMLIRRAYRALAERPLPPQLLRLVSHHDTPRVRGWRRVLAAAAATVLFVMGAASGWYGHELLAPALMRAESLVADAAAAHLVYAVEVRHPVEVPASEEAHLATWLGRRLAVPLRVPDLGESGYELVGGRLLPAADGLPAAQLMYQDGGGRRVTLYVRASPGGEQTAFRFAREGGLSALYWRDGDVAWVLVGELPRDQLVELAERVYAALQG
ncbi:MAG TPA: anti-sigma factor [Geminicoccaceae bacterium]